MRQYQPEPDNLTNEAIVVRIFAGHEGPVAMLHRGGPVSEGADYLFVPEGAFPVPAQLAVAHKLAERGGHPVFIRLEGVDWDQQWGDFAI